MLCRIRGVKQEGIEQEWIAKRLEFLFHHWTYIVSPRRYFSERYALTETYRTILDKIHYQLTSNADRCIPKLQRYMSSPIFDMSNSMMSDAVVRRNIKRIIKLLYSSSPSKQVRVRQLLACHKRLKQYLIDEDNYIRLMITSLNALIHKNTNPDESALRNLSFLCESFVLELFYTGYSSKYIRDLPRILLLRSALDDFPWKKTMMDFPGEKEKYQAYIEECRKTFTVADIVNALATLLERPMMKGYVVFKIEGLELKSDDIVSIGNVEFYNPQRRLYQTFQSSLSADRTKQLQGAEEFEYRKDEVRLRASSCNAVVPVEFRASSELIRTKEFIEALSLAESALELILEGVTWKIQSDPSIEAERHIMLHENKRHAGYNFKIGHYRAFDLEPKDIDDPLIPVLQKITTPSKYSKTLYEIYCWCAKRDRRPERFSFGELWSLWESLVDGSTSEQRKESIKALFQKFFVRYKSKKQLVDTFLFLHNNCMPSDLVKRGPAYILEPAIIANLGLSLSPPNYITTGKLKRNYQELRKEWDIPFIRTLCETLDLFLKDRDKWENMIREWVADVVEDFYVERNSEYHSRHRHIAHHIRIREEVLSFSRLASYSLLESIAGRKGQAITSLSQLS